MTDDLDDLKAMMDKATPRPDAARRAENIALAQKNFADLQGSRDVLRPTSATGPKGLWTGVKTMLNAITSKGGLTTTTALVACGFLFLTPQGQDILRPPSAPQITMTEFDGPAVAPRAETAPVMVEELGGDVALQSAPAPVETEQVQTPLVVPLSDDQFADRSLPVVRDRSTTLRAMQPSQLETDTIAGAAPQAELMDERAMVMPAPSTTKTTEGVSRLTAERRVVVAPSPQPADDIVVAPLGNTEDFANAAPNPLKITSEEPVSTFSIDVDTAAYTVVRSSLSRGQLPPPQAVRIEELINYFPYDYTAPDAGEAPFRPTVTTFQTPWNSDTQLVHIALQGQLPEIAARPPLNLVFLIDTSGSMDDPTKLPLLKQSFRLMLDQLRPQDQVAIVEYAGSAGQVLEPTSASERTTILQAIGSLGAGGSTNGQGGLEQAYSVAETMRESGEVNRVILATDGDFNVGLNDPEALKDFIADKRDTGTYLSVLGFGRGNLDDATMQALAQNGNGTAAYIDTLQEAQKVLVDQLTGALFPIANDVKIQVEFNPAQIAEYRLIGYETRILNRADFNNDKVDAGDIGAGHSVTALYEVTPVGSDARVTDDLRYSATLTEGSPELGFFKLRYKTPGSSESQLIETPITPDLTASKDAQFATAIAGFGALLKDDTYLNDWTYADAIALADRSKGDDSFGYRAEAIRLMRLAQSLAQ